MAQCNVHHMGVASVPSSFTDLLLLNVNNEIRLLLAYCTPTAPYTHHMYVGGIHLCRKLQLFVNTRGEHIRMEIDGTYHDIAAV